MKRTKLGVAGAAAAALAVGLTAQSAVAAAPAAPAFCAANTALTPANNSPIAIPDNTPAGVTRTITVTGATGTVRDVDAITNITHQNNGDLQIELTHAGKTVRFITSVIPNRSGANAFNGTRWDDSALEVVTEQNFNVSGAKPGLVPEGAMAAFNGTDPNGDWTLSVKDLDATGTGTLNSWSLDLRTGTSAPAASPVVNVSGAGGTVPETPGDGDLSRVVNVSGAGAYLTDVDLLTNITHVIDPAEVRMTLTSPAGTTVVISNGRGSGSLDALTTEWDDTATIAVAATNGTWGTDPGEFLTRPTMVPEGALSAFIGENPNGNWTLTVDDTVAEDPTVPGDDGYSLNGWSLQVNSTAGCAAPPTNPPTTNPPTTNPPVCVKTNLVASILGQKKAIRGRTAAVKIRVRNATAGASAGKTSAKFTLPAGFTLSSKPKGATLKRGVLTIPLGTIAGGKSKTVTVRLKAKTGAALGVKRRTVTVRANCGSADTAKLAVTVARAPR